MEHQRRPQLPRKTHTPAINGKLNVYASTSSPIFLDDKRKGTSRKRQEITQALMSSSTSNLLSSKSNNSKPNTNINQSQSLQTNRPFSSPHIDQIEQHIDQNNQKITSDNGSELDIDLDADPYAQNDTYIIKRSPLENSPIQEYIKNHILQEKMLIKIISKLPSQLRQAISSIVTMSFSFNNNLLNNFEKNSQEILIIKSKLKKKIIDLNLVKKFYERSKIQLKKLEESIKILKDIIELKEKNETKSRSLIKRLSSTNRMLIDALDALQANPLLLANIYEKNSKTAALQADLTPAITPSKNVANNSSNLAMNHSSPSTSPAPFITNNSSTSSSLPFSNDNQAINTKNLKTNALINTPQTDKLKESLLRIAREHYKSMKKNQLLETKVLELRNLLRNSEQINRNLKSEIEELQAVQSDHNNNHHLFNPTNNSSSNDSLEISTPIISNLTILPPLTGSPGPLTNSSLPSATSASSPNLSVSRYPAYLNSIPPNLIRKLSPSFLSTLPPGFIAEFNAKEMNSLTSSANLKLGPIKENGVSNSVNVNTTNTMSSINKRFHSLIERNRIDPLDGLTQLYSMSNHLSLSPHSLKLSDLITHILSKETLNIFNIEMINLYLCHPSSFSSLTTLNATSSPLFVHKFNTRSPTTPSLINLNEDPTNKSVTSQTISLKKIIKINSLKSKEGTDLFKPQIDGCVGITPRRIMSIPLINTEYNIAIGSVLFINKIGGSSEVFNEVDETFGLIFCQQILNLISSCVFHEELHYHSTMLRGLLESSTDTLKVLPTEKIQIKYENNEEVLVVEPKFESKELKNNSSFSSISYSELIHTLTPYDILLKIEKITKQLFSCTLLRTFLLTDSLPSQYRIEYPQYFGPNRVIYLEQGRNRDKISTGVIIPPIIFYNLAAKNARINQIKNKFLELEKKFTPEELLKKDILEKEFFEKELKKSSFLDEILPDSFKIPYTGSSSPILVSAPISNGIVSNCIRNSTISIINKGDLEKDIVYNDEIDLYTNKNGLLTMPIIEYNNKVIGVLQIAEGLSTPKLPLVSEIGEVFESNPMDLRMELHQAAHWLANQISSSLRYVIDSLVPEEYKDILDRYYTLFNKNENSQINLVNPASPLKGENTNNNTSPLKTRSFKRIGSTPTRISLSRKSSFINSEDSVGHILNRNLNELSSDTDIITSLNEISKISPSHEIDTEKNNKIVSDLKYEIELLKSDLNNAKQYNISEVTALRSTLDELQSKHSDEISNLSKKVSDQEDQLKQKDCQLEQANEQLKHIQNLLEQMKEEARLKELEYQTKLLEMSTHLTKYEPQHQSAVTEEDPEQFYDHKTVPKNDHILEPESNNEYDPEPISEVELLTAAPESETTTAPESETIIEQKLQSEPELEPELEPEPEPEPVIEQNLKEELEMIDVKQPETELIVEQDPQSKPIIENKYVIEPEAEELPIEKSEKLSQLLNDIDQNLDAEIDQDLFNDIEQEIGQQLEKQIENQQKLSQHLESNIQIDNDNDQELFNDIEFEENMNIDGQKELQDQLLKEIVSNDQLQEFESEFTKDKDNDESLTLHGLQELVTELTGHDISKGITDKVIEKELTGEISSPNKPISTVSDRPLSRASAPKSSNGGSIEANEGEYVEPSYTGRTAGGGSWMEVNDGYGTLYWMHYDSQESVWDLPEGIEIDEERIDEEDDDEPNNDKVYEPGIFDTIGSHGSVTAGDYTIEL